MLAARNAQGQQVADPAKFPNGFQAVTDYIHGLGMKSGLYTAKGPNTCQHRAASCEHEVIDAAQWASWGIDYVKGLLFTEVAQLGFLNLRPRLVSSDHA
jgi:alpha-galactosidase